MSDDSELPTLPTPALLVLVSCPPQAAESLARTLVEQRLAACVQSLGPAQSVYRWKAGIEASLEALLLIKTTARAYPALETRLRELHPYDLPEIVSIPLAGLPEYLDWVRRCVD